MSHVFSMALIRRSVRVRARSERALEIISARDPREWSTWRRQYNLFGDHEEARIDLARANLQGRDLRSFTLMNVDFGFSNLQAANLSGCDCTSCNFHQANLIAADLRGASLRGANLSRAYLRAALLDQADLRFADLRRASLTGASLRGADLRNVDLLSTRGLTQEQLDVAIGDERTVLPPHITRPAHWAAYLPTKELLAEGGVPQALPATLEVSIEAGRLTVAADRGDALFTTSFDEYAIRQNIIDDLQSILPRLSNAGEVHRAAARYLEILVDHLSDIIIVGMRGEQFATHIRHLAEGDGSDFLLPDVLGALRGVILQHYLYINQSHKWRSFLEEAQRSKFGHADVAPSIRDAASLSGLLRENESVCEAAVPEALDIAAKEVKGGVSEPKLLVFNLYAGVNNVLRALASWAMREFKRAGGTAWNSFRETVAKQVGIAGAAVLTATTTWFFGTQLSQRWPEYFGWFEFFARLLK